MGYPTDEQFEEARRHRAPPSTGPTNKYGRPLTVKEIAYDERQRAAAHKFFREMDVKVPKRLYNFHLSIGFAGASHDEQVDVLGELNMTAVEFDAMTEDEKNEAVEGIFLDWRNNYIDSGFSPVGAGEEE